MVTNCAKCTNDYCYECNENYVAIIESGYTDRIKYCIHIDEVKCYQYIKNCEECDEKNQSICAKCKDGYYLDKSKNSCERIFCDLHCCDVCDINQNCLVENEYYIIVNNNCTRLDDCSYENDSNCSLCDKNTSLCYSCKWGYHLENNMCVKSECSKIDDKDKRCFACSTDNNEICVICNPGYYRNDDMYDCMKYRCPRKGGKRERCELCDDKANCLSCKEGFELINNDCYVVGECPQNKLDRCEVCEENGNCITCNPGYTFNNVTKDCDKIICPDDKLERCDLCDLNGNCLSCKPDNELDDYNCYSTICPPSVEFCVRCNRWGDCKECIKDYLPYFGKCNYHPSHGCLKYDENEKDCIECDSSMDFEMNDEKVCVKLPEKVGPSKEETVDITKSNSVIIDENSKTVEIKTNIGDLDKDKSYLIDIDKDISTVKIDNTEYKINLKINGLSIVDIQTIENEKAPLFDVIINSYSDNNCSVNLPSSSKTTIKGEGNVILSSNDEKSLNVNSFVLDGSSSSSFLHVYQKVPLTIDELNLYGDSYLFFHKEDLNLITTANQVNVEQRSFANLKNVNVKKLNIKLLGRFNLEENVNIDDSDVEIIFDDAQSINKIPIIGQIFSTPKSIKLIDLNKNRALSNKEYIPIAEFYYDSSSYCEKWADSINNKYEPHPVYKYASCNGNKLNLVTKLSDEQLKPNPGNPGSSGGGKDNDGMNPGIIAAIVIACIVVVVAIILVLYFFVFRKRKSQSSSAENADNEEV